VQRCYVTEWDTDRQERRRGEEKRGEEREGLIYIYKYK
jgi:hypothetical protein